jgi:hypothetical protein
MYPQVATVIDVAGDKIFHFFATNVTFLQIYKKWNIYPALDVINDT